MHNFFSQFEDGPSPRGPRTVDNEKYYNIIGVDKKASQKEIQKAYRKKAMKLHPDKHPNEKEKYQKLFQELQEAYECLKDSKKRSLYDRYGEDGLKGGSSGIHDIFEMFGGGGGFGGFGGGHRRQRAKKAPPIRKPIDVTLEDLYIGSSHKISYKRYVLCKFCNGKGGKEETTCKDCKGRGVQIVMQRMGYMTIQQQRTCPTCEGEGKVIRDSEKCKKCDGKGMNEKQESKTIQIPPGSKHADQIRLAGQGHEIPNASSGDIVIIIRTDKHKLYKRIGADLFLNYQLNLKQALTGYDIRIPHLSKQTLRIRSKKGEIVQHGDLKRVMSYGMPQKGSNGIYGHLYIKFEIVFPKTGELSDKHLNLIKSIFPDPNPMYKKTVEDLEKRKKKRRKERQKRKKQNQKNKNNNNNNNNNTNDMKTDEGEDNNNNNNNNNDNTNHFDSTNIHVDYDTDDDEDLEVHEEAEDVEGEPTVTPSSAKNMYDEDEEQQNVGGCRHM